MVLVGDGFGKAETIDRIIAVCGTLEAARARALEEIDAMRDLDPGYIMRECEGDDDPNMWREGDHAWLRIDPWEVE